MLRNWMIVFFLLLLPALQQTCIKAQPTDWVHLIDTWRKEYKIPGMSVGIIRNGEILLSEGFGVLEEGQSVKADKHTLYSIASNTKAFVTACISVLVEEGKLHWDDPVRQYLPYFQLYDPCVSEMITVRDLLCHRSGLGTFSGDVVWYRSEYPAQEVVRRASEIPRAFEFRSGFGYSNMMYITAGEVIQAVTGKSWADFARETFFTPLQMRRTVTSVSALASLSNVATPHKTVEDGNQPISWVNWDNMGAAGGMISSVDDMLRWMRLLLHDGIYGQDTLLSKRQQLTMWTPHVNFPVSDRARALFGGRNFNGYGLGWGTSEYHGRQMVSHTGGYDGMYSAVYLLPGEKLGVVVLTNSMSGISTMLSYELIDRILGLPQQDWKERGKNQDRAGLADRATRINKIMDARIPDTRPTMEVSVISGLYRCAMYGDIRILEEQGQLLIDFVQAPELKARLHHWHHDTYSIDWIQDQAWFGFGTVQVQKDNNGAPIQLLFEVPNDDIFFEEIQAKRVQP